MSPGNTSSSAGLGYGGAIATEDVQQITITNSQFTNNSVEATVAAYGGAIINLGADLKITNTDFINNSATSGDEALGGAIYIGSSEIGNGKLTLIADGKDILFSGNKANSVSNAIYAEDDTTVNLNAENDSSIIFNDGISSGNSILNINNSVNHLPSSGNILVNADMSEFFGDINLYGGTLKIGEKGTFFNNAHSFSTNDGATIDFQNGKIDNAQINEFSISGTTNIKIDADLKENAIDNFNVTSSTSNGTLNIEDVNILTLLDSDGTISKSIINAPVNLTVSSDAQTILTQNNRFDINVNGTDLTIAQKAFNGGIVSAVVFNETNDR